MRLRFYIKGRSDCRWRNCHNRHEKAQVNRIAISLLITLFFLSPSNDEIKWNIFRSLKVRGKFVFIAGGWGCLMKCCFVSFKWAFEFSIEVSSDGSLKCTQRTCLFFFFVEEENVCEFDCKISWKIKLRLRDRDSYY